MSQSAEEQAQHNIKPIDDDKVDERQTAMSNPTKNSTDEIQSVKSTNQHRENCEPNTSRARPQDIIHIADDPDDISEPRRFHIRFVVLEAVR